MPVATVDIVGSKSRAYKDALAAAVRRSIVEFLAADDSRVTVRIIETPADCVDLPSCRTERYTVVGILLYEGRTEEMKRAFAEGLRAALAADPGIEPCEIAIALHSMSTSDLDVLPGQSGL